ncbi:MAG TPA: glycoside hydrolase family 43 protein [Steroidobacteraceae bacterium]|jgi:alpha-N-arabinofuranosidase
MKRGVPLLLALSLWTSAAPAQSVDFDWFEYSGHDAVFERPLPSGSYRNPVLAGFYPDPSVTRVGNKFYLVNSTFTYFPGIPVFESGDLVHWRQIGNAVDRVSEISFDGLDVSRGLFAPTIRYHCGTFYIINTAVASGGNFYLTATNPAGPWSAPHWLPEIDGIDPSFFFDTDGKAYVLNNGPPEGTPLYEGHRAIWIQAFDLFSHKLIGPRKVLLNGGIDFASHPLWIEGPHMYRRGRWYYLMCAQGGTSSGHSEVVLRSHSPWGPFSAFTGNPILTQRDVDARRADPIVNAGHADLVEGPDHSWWAVFLAGRGYGEGHFNTGRETFLLPVSWRHGWPIILDHGRSVPYVLPGPRFLAMASDLAPTTGNFTWRDDFDGDTLKPEWLHVRTPTHPWVDLASRHGWLRIEPQVMPLDGLGNPSFLARRQQHMSFEATTAFELPGSQSIVAGIAAFQNQSYWYFLGARHEGDRVRIFLEKKSGGAVQTVAATLTTAQPLMKLKISAASGAYSFFYDAGGGWQTLVSADDGSILSSDVAGGFVGAVVGPFARVTDK